jgi:PiT family inorganic phosphate transporter
MTVPWAVLLILVGGIYMAWTIGANDVANAMGTSVGSGALSMRKALLVAGIFELAGATLVGSHVTDTVAKGIVSPATFGAETEIYIYGMVAALFASAIWVHLATRFGYPVSTTHAIVGAVAGFGIAAGGTGAVGWGRMATIVASWFTSPVLGGILGFLLFYVVSRGILDTPRPVARTRRFAPAFVFLTVFVITLATLYKGLKNLKLHLSLPAALGLACGLGVVAAAIAGIGIARYLSGKEDLPLSEQFNHVERIFRYLQVMTAATVAFAHGSNDVANAVGPVAGVLAALKTGTLASKAGVPFGVLVLGGVGIVIGLATWGYKVILTIGSRITELTCTRGFSAELSTAITILLASRLGLPISTTHVIVGAVVGVGFARGMAALNLQVLRDIVYSWILTVPVAAALAAGLFFLIRAAAS